jgi:hypothetical protein
MTGMPPISPKRKKAKGKEQVLSDATRRLLSGIKAKAQKDGKPLTRAELRRRGYPEEFIAQLEAA